LWQWEKAAAVPADTNKSDEKKKKKKKIGGEFEIRQI